MNVNIAVSQPNGGALTETFIRNDISEFRKYANVYDLSDGWIPSRANQQPITPAWISRFEKAMARAVGREFIYGITSKTLSRYLQRQNIRLVMSCFGPGGVALSPVCKKNGIPHVVHFYGIDLTGKKILARYGQAYQSLFKDAAAIIAISKSQMRILEQMGCPPHKIHYGVCGAHPDFAKRQTDFSHKTFLAVGRLTPKKAPHKTIEAFAHIADKIPEFSLTIVGAGELYDQCAKMITDYNLAHRVRLLGGLDHRQVIELMSKAYCFVQHSVTTPDNDMEGTPISIVEAGMAGLPVVSTRHAGIPDVVVEGETGFLVDENDVASMSAHMLTLATNPQLAMKIGQQAGAHAKANFSLEATAAAKWQILKSYIK